MGRRSCGLWDGSPCHSGRCPYPPGMEDGSQSATTSSDARSVAFQEMLRRTLAGSSYS